MLQAQINDSDSDPLPQNLIQNGILQFQYPPANVKQKIWPSKQTLLHYIHSKGFEIGYFQNRMFNCKRINSENKLSDIKCKFCNAKLSVKLKQNGQVIVEKMNNFHKHSINKHQQSFVKRYFFFQDHSVEEYIEQIQQLFDIDRLKATVWRNTYYRNFITFHQILLKINRNTGAKFKVWKNPITSIPYLILIVTPTMRENFIKFGQSVSIDSLPKLKQIKKNADFWKFWCTWVFSSLDSNNKLVLFGVAIFAHNQDLYYEQQVYIFELLKGFFEMMSTQQIITKTLITIEKKQISCAINRLKLQTGLQFDHLFGWNYKIRNLVTDMMNTNYSIDQILKLLPLYGALLREIQWSSYYETIAEIIKLSHQSDVLFDFLCSLQKYCYLGFPNKYCGFGLILCRSQSFSKMAHYLLEKQNFYKQFMNVIEYQKILLQNSRKILLSPRTQYYTIQEQLKIFLACLAQQVGFFRTSQPYSLPCLQSAIFEKVMENFNFQRSYKIERISQTLYKVYKPGQNPNQQQVLWSQAQSKWLCSCMYQEKMGIICLHLIKVIIRQKKCEHKYFHQRFLRKNQQPVYKAAPQRISRKRRRVNFI